MLLDVVTAPRCEHRQVSRRYVEPDADRRGRGRCTQPQNRPQLSNGGCSGQIPAMREVAAPQGVTGAFEGIDIRGTHLPWRFVGIQTRYQSVQPVHVEFWLSLAEGDLGNRLPDVGQDSRADTPLVHPFTGSKG
ncbi:MAG TPA: hypothetical protein VJT72_01110 [Pseudonocardiaceae bacterium]|nr:hypothetical protein [Pseudonocardiaceae bacterium]